MEDQRRNLEQIFERANNQFLRKNSVLFKQRVSERTLCGALMLELHDVIKNTEYSGYFVDVEYNRNVGGQLKTFRKTIKGPSEEIVTINCDLIVHSRGQNVRQDNLIAVEMKKSTAIEKNKESDRIRLECLTKECDDDVRSYGSKVFPEHVCGYLLGIYYEINSKHSRIDVEYYMNGYNYKNYEIYY